MCHCCWNLLMNRLAQGWVDDWFRGKEGGGQCVCVLLQVGEGGVRRELRE